MEQEVAQELRSAFDIEVSPSWLNECLSFLRMNGPHSNDVKSLAKFVFQKFLDFDLAASSAMGVLPDNLQRLHQVTMFKSSPVVLQINQLLNIASSKANQQKRKIDVMNKAVTTSNPVLLVESEIQEEDTADIGKMNKLLLTDGFSIVVGLDLQGLCASAKSVGPGTKILCHNVPLRRGTLILEESNCKLLGGTVACFAATPLSSLNDHRLNNKSPKRGEETEEQKEDLVPMDIDVGNDFNEHYDQRESPFKMPEKNWTEKSNNAHDSVSQLLISPIQPSLASGHIDLSLSSTEARVFESPVHQDNGCNCSKSSSDLASNEHTAYSLSLSYHHNMQQNSSRVTFIRGFAGKLYRFKLAKDSSKKYFFDVIVEFDDGFTSVAAIVSPSLCEKFLGIKAEEFKKSLSLSTDVTQETKKLMLNFQTLHGVFEARTLTSSEKLTAKNNASIQLEAILESGGIANVVTTFFKHSVVNYK